MRAEIRAFAVSYVGGFCWQWWWLRQPAENCRTFQQGMFEAVGLFEEPEYLYTQGSGCPFMYPFRRVRWRIQDLLAAAVTPMRWWSPAHRRRSGLRVATDLADGTVEAKRQPDAFPSPLTDPRARARARIRGTLLAGRTDPADSG